jgi:hypothetical protein
MGSEGKYNEAIGRDELFADDVNYNEEFFQELLYCGDVEYCGDCLVRHL